MTPGASGRLGPARSDGFTRRALLRRGGATAAGGGLLASLTGPAPATADRFGGEPGSSALLVVLPLVRADYVKAFDGGSGTDTPNLNELTGKSLRFDRAIPECMPALPVRRTLVTGMRSFPFRAWERTDGMPAVPGYNPVFDWQPVLTETMRLRGVRTLYVTDNPILDGPRFPDVRRPVGTPPAASSAEGLKAEIAAIGRQSAAADRTFRAGIRALGELDGDAPYFLAIDPFDPVDAAEAPPIYVKPGEVDKEGIGPMNDRLVELKFGREDIEELRAAYRKHVEQVDRWVGRLMDAVPDDVFLFMLGDVGIALGEHDYAGRGTPTSHRESYEIPYLIRHPKGEKAGDDMDWYASTHDVAPTLLSSMGLTIPGKMRGEDLTQLFDDVDEEDLPDRPFSITCSGSLIVVRDKRWLMVADREEVERRLYDDDEEADDDDMRYDDVANDEPGVLTDLSLAALTVAGGTLPEFGPDGALRPSRQRGDDDIDDDGIPNDWDAVDNENPDDDDEPGDVTYDGRDPEDRIAAPGGGSP
ncbi:MAG: sulfatase-like hydrolase/transferase [Thermoleophilaceae bacterium]|nr:sulfatase-like hydrolase/transferase [Thermoleophilaceae bacterium]